MVDDPLVDGPLVDDSFRKFFGALTGSEANGFEQVCFAQSSLEVSPSRRLFADTHFR